MTETYYSSDHHFGHANTFLKFKKADGSPLRSFTDVTEMNEYIIQQHNSVVGIKDTVIMCGDVTMHSSNLSIVDRLNGIKILILGNHDEPQHINEYAKYFKSVHGVLGDKKNKLVYSHVPLHTASLGRWSRNVTGHLHSNVVNDIRYLNVSVEQLPDYKPINTEEVKLRFEINEHVFNKTGNVVNFSENLSSMQTLVNDLKLSKEYAEHLLRT
jgi:calcineurin-like phosphoesterase family protein